MKKIIIPIFALALLFTELHISAQENEPQIHAMNSEKLNFGIAADFLYGFLLNGPTVSVEFTKNAFNAQVYGLFPFLGENFHIFYLPKPNNIFSELYESAFKEGGGFGLALNHFRHTRYGGFYIGGLFEYVCDKAMLVYHYSGGNWVSLPQLYINYIGLALNIGYKFVTRSGVYFRTGGHIGAGIYLLNTNFGDVYLIFRPDLSIGYNFKRKK